MSDNPESAPAAAEESGRNRRNLAMGLTAIVPGLGHFVYGSRPFGVIYLLLSGGLLVIGGGLLLQIGRSVFVGGEWARPLGGMVALTVWGAVYTAVLLWDARRIPEKPSKGVLAVSLAQAVLFLSAIWFIMAK